MQTYRIETTVSKDGAISIKGLPFAKGEKVEILMRSRKREKDKKLERYSLRGLPVTYTKPFDSISENDWAVLE
ncbi:MAG: hypothetical protein DRI56_05395 [Chloroflexota bacterium]|nr:MAG: hypothetical protein DRI56_05395 [Chloroflexota bacterium]